MMGTARSLSSMLLLLSLLGTVEVLAAQSPSLSQSPANADAAPNDSTYQLKVQVRRAIVDVIVTDTNGKPVQGLKQDDFKLMEDGVTQPLRSFDAHPGVATGAAQPALNLHLPPNTFSNLALAPPDKPVTVLLYDMLNTPQAALPFAHQALIQFIKSQKNSTKIAIFALTDRLHMVQGFTEDETRLIAAVDSKKANLRISQMRPADTGADEAALLAADPAATASLTQPTTQTSSEEAVLTQLQDAEKAETDYQEGVRIQTTVEAFSDIARFVSLLPGRKNLIWMAGSFPVEIWPNRKPNGDDGVGGFNLATRLDAEIREAQELMKDSRIAIYPVDIRGLQTDPQFTAPSQSARLPPRVPISGGGPPPPPSFGVQQGAEHAIMDSIAESTGGRAFYNTNGLQEAMSTALNQGSDYYTLTYAPSDSKEDGGEREIKIVLTNPNYRLFYRRRYLALDDKHHRPLRALPLDQNMQHGAPDSSELFFETTVVPVGPPVAASAAEIEELKSFLHTNAKGKRSKIADGLPTVQHYDINLAVIGRQLQMPAVEGGRYATDMRFGLAAYTQDSELLNGTEVSIKNSIPAAQYQKIESEGYHASMLFAVPIDAVSLRIAVRDEIGDRIGTMEIPLPISVAKGTASAKAP